jgi:hypothetical protein
MSLTLWYPKPLGNSNLTPYCHISLPYITNIVINAYHEKSTDTLTLRHVLICGVPPSYSYSSISSSCAICWMLVHAYATCPGKVKWSGPHHNIKLLHFVLFHSVTCYTNSIVSCIHVHITKLRDITCTLVGTRVILRNLKCISHGNHIPATYKDEIESLVCLWLHFTHCKSILII